MRAIIVASLFLLGGVTRGFADILPASGLASWYGEAHRGKLMANGQRFDPDKLTAASWFYPLGTKVKVTLASPRQETRVVVVTITDRGPAWRFVRRKRIIDLTVAAFKELAEPDLGLVAVKVEPHQ
jgi:rare lipoprotein A